MGDHRENSWHIRWSTNIRLFTSFSALTIVEKAGPPLSVLFLKPGTPLPGVRSVSGPRARGQVSLSLWVLLKKREPILMMKAAE